MTILASAITEVWALQFKVDHLM